MIPLNVLLGIVSKSSGCCLGINLLCVFVQPAIPTHVLVQVIHGDIHEVKICLHDPARFLHWVAKGVLPMLDPLRLKPILNVVQDVPLILFDERCNC
jgi:hypothetical protein